MNNPLPTHLERIIAEKHKEITERCEKIPQALIEHLIAELDEQPRGFYQALVDKVNAKELAIVGDINRNSLNKEDMFESFDPVDIAKKYEKEGAACLSAATDEKFLRGSEDYLDMVRDVVELPVMRKDFIVDAYQIYESRAVGADCILLMAACLTHEQMQHLTLLAYELGMDVLIEVCNQSELDKVKGIPIRMLSINYCDVQKTISLVEQLPKDLLVIKNSSITAAEDIARMNKENVHAFWVDDHLMCHRK